MRDPERTTYPISTYRLLLLLAAAVLTVDQLTKFLISRSIDYGSFYPPNIIQVVPDFFNLVHVGNTGAAWSLFTGYSIWLAVIGFGALIVIWFMRNALQLELRVNQWAFGLIIGGIIGNLIDRVRLGYVIDFLDFQFGSWHFPSFNVADSGITVGVTIYAIASIFHDLGKKKENASTP